MFRPPYPPTMRFEELQPEHVFEPLKVDLVAESPDGVTELVIVQSNRWTGSDAQIGSLQGKVQAYVSFALDGGLVQHFPETKGRPWRIVVHSRSGEPDGRTQYVLDALAARLPDYGGSLVVRQS